MTLSRLTLLLGAFSTLLILGALAFEYFGGLAPCEMCMWQRWPHIAAAVVGIGGGALLLGDRIDARYARAILILVIIAIAVSGLIGIYHAGVEWKWWAGPSACTGERVEFTGLEGINDKGNVRCDIVQWRLAGISLAGYNAILSAAAATLGVYVLWKRRAA
ncbi:MAG: disulfide bond formation protein B [Alphaproteobacteria bacterium]|nr:disulfide bond formation protein B [Alphaproteobacteria bacterium]